MVAAKQEGWSSRTAFILASVGAAVGLGNLWRFPTLAGESGGAAFVLIYIACVIFIGLPLVLSEVLIGRAGRKDAVGSVVEVAKQSGKSSKWAALGLIEVFAAFLIMTTYSVVAGWVIYYVYLFAGDFFANLLSGNVFSGAFNGQSSEEIGSRMKGLFADTNMMIALHAIFLVVTMWVVMRGIANGIEKAAMILMPAFFILLVCITIYSGFTGNFSQAATFLFEPDFSKISTSVINDALGQALFSMSLGSAALMTYGAYVSDDTKLAPTAGMIALADTGVALIAGLMIFPIVFAAGLSPDSGPTLMFQSIPIAFNSMPAGSFIGLAFFVLVFFAALTSSISLVEAQVAWLINSRGWSRIKSSLVIAAAIFAIGILGALSFGPLKEIRVLFFWPLMADLDIFNVLDALVGKLILPVAALLTAIFIGWQADKKLVDAQTGLEGGLFTFWRFLVGWVGPIAVGSILIFALFPDLLPN